MTAPKKNRMTAREIEAWRVTLLEIVDKENREAIGDLCDLALLGVKGLARGWDGRYT